MLERGSEENPKGRKEELGIQPSPAGQLAQERTIPAGSRVSSCTHPTRSQAKRKEAERSAGPGVGGEVATRPSSAGTRRPLSDFTGFATNLDRPRPTHPAAGPPSALSPLSTSLPPGLGLPRLSRSLRPAAR